MPELLALIFRRCWNQHPWNQHPWNFSASGFLYVLLTPSWVQWELWGFSAPCSSLRTHRGVSQEGNIQLPKALGFSRREYRSAGRGSFLPHPSWTGHSQIQAGKFSPRAAMGQGFSSQSFVLPPSQVSLVQFQACKPWKGE